MTHYTYNELSYGALVISPEGTEVFLQGDDHTSLATEIDEVKALWQSGGNPNSEIFTCLDDHVDLLLTSYF